MRGIKSHFTCPHCCQMMEIEAQGKVLKVEKVRIGVGEKGEAEPRTEVTRPETSAIGGSNAS